MKCNKAPHILPNTLPIAAFIFATQRLSIRLLSEGRWFDSNTVLRPFHIFRICFITPALSPSSCRIDRLAALASAEYKPCFQFPRRARSSPAGVRGPVDLPPCNRQRCSIFKGRQSIPMNAAILPRSPHNSLTGMLLPPNEKTGFPSACSSAFFGDATMAISSP